jgi:hypothetical protein
MLSDSVEIATKRIHSVVMASVVQIIYIQALSSYTDLLNSIWRIVVCGQIVQVTSVMTAIIPFLKPFLTSLESGFISATTAFHAVTPGDNTTRPTRHPSSYIKLGSSQVRDPLEQHQAN